MGKHYQPPQSFGTVIYSQGERVYPGPIRRALSAMVGALFGNSAERDPRAQELADAEEAVKSESQRAVANGLSVAEQLREQARREGWAHLVEPVAPEQMDANFKALRAGVNDGWTGNPPGLLQDDSRDLSRALASKPRARMRARNAAAEAQAFNAAAPLPHVCRWPLCACGSKVCGPKADEVRAEIAAEAAKHPPGSLINTGDVPADTFAGVGGGGIFAGMPAAGVWDPEWQRKAIEAAQTLAVEHRVIAHRVESERERRTRLLAEWQAHRAAAPMAAGRVPGEPMPRSEEELIEQAAALAGPQHARDEQTWALLFSMALTYCRLERAPFYEEHDGNRLVSSMVRSTRGMAA
jgi:hypothetical protein